MKKLLRYFLPFLLITSVLVWIHWSRLPHGHLAVHFLDVGQGDSILLQTPSGQVVLIDGGPGTEVMSEIADILPFLEKKIDLMILTHPHSDHVEGLVPVLRRYEVEAALITGVSYRNSYYLQFLEDLKDEAEVYFAHADQDFDLGDGVVIDVLYPFEPIIGEEFGNVNNSSIVVRITYEDHSILLAGDAEFEVENELLESGVTLNSDIFKASHHASKTANTLDFFDEISPGTVVIQVGQDNSFGHPHKDALDAFDGTKVYRNDLDGRVSIVL